MDTENLVKMANRIGQFFAAMPDTDKACGEIALHLRKFWEPRMRSALLAHLDAQDGRGLLPLVRKALIAHRDLLTTPTETAR